MIVGKKARRKGENMSVYISHCEKCLRKIDMIPIAASNLFFKLCIGSVEIDTYIYQGKNEKMVRCLSLLERRGFILTTEASNDELFVKVLGHEIDQDDEGETHYFCICKDNCL